MLHNSKVIMCSIQNFHIDWMIDSERNYKNAPPKGKIGRFDEEIILLTPLEISKLTKKYVIMYRNR